MRVLVRGKRNVDDLTPEELVLVLGRYSGGVVPGALYLQKLAFLVAYEGKDKTSSLRKRLAYRPLNFGPYSSVVRSAADELVGDRRLVTKREFTNKYNKEVFFLTESGSNSADSVVRSLDEWSVDYLTRISGAARQLGYLGLLRYVYRVYEKFASKSEIIDDVISSYDRY